ncbi:metallophosphoesterase family protein [Terricaulis silvestris]|uniref:Putative phosphoesterase n=1 Tax=Terricaulis silvestris TaxID=2686094 RepID=A0A6I6MRR3_9CAUL|nr:metallophosphoesterase [Terricaulis silvestris]QGZ94322.1 putative phosphoesterase [Terricaulis silvestris]
MTPSTDKRLRVAAIGDLHVQESRTDSYKELFQEIASVADVLVLCGDLTNYGKTSEIELLADDLAGIQIPIVAVLGNHDHECGQPEVIKSYLSDAGVRVLDNGESFEIEGVGFAGCMGAMGGFGRGMLSSFGEKAVKAFVHECLEETMKLETSLRMLRTERAVAVLHYSPVADTLEGEPLEIFPFLGNSRLAHTVDQFDNVRAVVHGHAHRGVHKGKTPKGTPVYNCAQMVALAATGRPYALIEV